MPLRIASLLPSATEIVAALGAAGELVARSHECDFPPGVERLPALTEARLDPAGPSAEIHRRMETAVAEALSVYRVDAEALRTLRPDVVVTQAQCEVCAVSEDEVRAALAGWAGEGTELVSLTAADLGGVFEDVDRVAAALGRESAGARLIARMRARMTKIAERAGAGSGRPRVLLVEWIEPPMAGGNWMPELIELAGGEPLFAEGGAHSPWIEWEDVAAADPDAIVVAPCGFDLQRTAAELEALVDRPEWASLGAVQRGRVAAADGSAFFNRPGPRLVETLEILAEILHPGRFDFGHEGRDWRRVDRRA